MPRRPLEGTWRDGFAQVEENLARLGIGNVEDCEIWEVAAKLGANSVDSDGDSPASVDVDPLQFQAM